MKVLAPILLAQLAIVSASPLFGVGGNNNNAGAAGGLLGALAAGGAGAGAGAGADKGAAAGAGAAATKGAGAGAGAAAEKGAAAGATEKGAAAGATEKGAAAGATEKGAAAEATEKGAAAGATEKGAAAGTATEKGTAAGAGTATEKGAAAASGAATEKGSATGKATGETATNGTASTASTGATPKANGGPSTQSPAQIQLAILGYANDVSRVNRFLDEGANSTDPAALAQDAANAEADEIEQLKALCPANESEAASTSMAEACSFLLANTQPIVDMLQVAADKGNGAEVREQMLQTMTEISKVRCPMVLPRIQTLVNGAAGQSSVNSTMIPRPAACRKVAPA